MSALGGIYNFNGTPLDRQTLNELAMALASSGPDGGSEFVSTDVALIYRAFHTNEESRRETQPLVSANGRVLCWDGRLDSRDELLPILRDELFGDHSDAAIALAAYERWGRDFLSTLVGDFALSLWDPAIRTLLLARDPVGPRPLFYYGSNDRIIWTSELAALVDLPGIPLEVNDEYVAGYLTRLFDGGLTPYKGIHAVPPGNAVVVRNSRINATRYWALGCRQKLRYKTDAEYEEHFRHLFREAVRCRLRADGPVWAMLSGGLDSSAIVCMADDILGRGEAAAPGLETVSFVYDGSPSADEREFLCCLEEKRGRIGHHVRETGYPPLASRPDEKRHYGPDFLDCFVARHKAMLDLMRRGAARVLLTGHGGDEMLLSSQNPSSELQDLLVQTRVLQLHRALQTWSKALKTPYIKLLLRNAILPLLPESLQVVFADGDNKVPFWYDEQFVRTMNLRERLVGCPDDFSIQLPSDRNNAAGFLSIVSATSRASYRASGCVEVSHPYLHRPLVDFLHAIPLEQKVRPGETRSLMRRSLRDLLPEKILNRKDKKGPTEALLRAIARESVQLRAMFENAQVCSYGYMNAEALLKALDRARHGCEKESFALIQTISLEFWLRSLRSRGSMAKSAAEFRAPVAPHTAAQQPGEPIRRGVNPRQQLL